MILDFQSVVRPGFRRRGILWSKLQTSHFCAGREAAIACTIGNINPIRQKIGVEEHDLRSQPPAPALFCLDLLMCEISIVTPQVFRFLSVMRRFGSKIPVFSSSSSVFLNLWPPSQIFGRLTNNSIRLFFLVRPHKYNSWALFDLLSSSLCLPFLFIHSKKESFFAESSTTITFKSLLTLLVNIDRRVRLFSGEAPILLHCFLKPNLWRLLKFWLVVVLLAHSY